MWFICTKFLTPSSVHIFIIPALFSNRPFDNRPEKERRRGQDGKGATAHLIRRLSFSEHLLCVTSGAGEGKEANFTLSSQSLWEGTAASQGGSRGKCVAARVLHGV